MAAGMLLQTLYFFVDLYFVSRLGEAAVAGVAVAANLMFVVFFLSQALAVGTVSLVSRAVGRKDRTEANLVFNQAIGVAGAFAIFTLVAGYAIVGPFSRFFAPDEAARTAGATFLYWYLPSLALQFATVVLAAALRATGIVKPTTVVQAGTVLLNAALAPVLVMGWGTGVPLGVAGAGLATTISVIAGVAALVWYFLRLEHYVSIDMRQWRPDWPRLKSLFNVGIPAGAEFGLMAIFAGILYWAARDFGTSTQGGLGIGFRVNQMVMIPALAVAFAAAPIAGQNFGAGHAARVRETFRATAAVTVVVMGLVTLAVQLFAEPAVRIFTAEAAVVASAVEYMRIISFNFIPIGLSLCASGVMQGMGNTWPALGCTAIRIGTFAPFGIAMALQPWFEMRYLYALAVASAVLQAVASWFWLQSQFRRRLGASGSLVLED